MYIGSRNLLKAYDRSLLTKGYSVEQLIDLASDCLYKHFSQYHNIAILVGPGNNGGDGLSLGLKLAQDHKEVTFYYIGNWEEFSKGNQYYFKQCKQQLKMYEITEEMIDDFNNTFHAHEVIVDAFFGFGLHSSPRGLYQAIIEEINKNFEREVIAIDIPTGLDCNTGIPYQSVLYATQTITLTALKEGFLNPDSRTFTGAVIVETLAVEDIYEEAGLFKLINHDFAVNHLKERLFYGYKQIYGVDGMITGSPMYKGAALLSARSAMLSGAGIVKVLSCKEVTQLLPLSTPEVIAIERPPVLREEDLNGYHALLVGCGLGLDIDAYRYVIDVLSLSTCPLVIDADALTILSSNLSLLEKQERSIVLTPHLGEFKRLCVLSEDDDLMEAAAAFASVHHVILVLKGPYTIVTDGTHHYRIDAGDKAMAVGGMGDALAGIITSFLGQKYQPLEAVLMAVYLHGYTGALLAKNAYTVMPEDLINALPATMHQLIKEKEAAKNTKDCYHDLDGQQ